MITETYPNPVKKVFALPYAYSASTPAVRDANGQPPMYNEHQAKKKGITTEEFVRRDKLVRDEANKMSAGIFLGALVYPHSLDEMKRVGPHRITQIYRSYADFENSIWDEDKWNYLVAARRVESPHTVTIATPRYFVTKEPTV